MSKNTEKSWSQGFHRISNTSKFLAGDPDIKFISYTLDNCENEDSSDDEETVTFSKEINSKYSPSQEVNDQEQKTVSIEVIDLVSVNSDEYDPKQSSDNYISSLLEDIPLDPCIRENIIEYLNSSFQEKILEEDGC